MARLPEDTHRTMILGRTGTGKSQFGLHLLSQQDWDYMPWVIIDYKGEDLIQDMLSENGWKKSIRKGKTMVSPRMDSPIKLISPEDSKLPRNPGLYYMPVRPIIDDDIMEAWLMRVHKQGNIGLFVDEGYAMPKYGSGPGFTLVLTQGRSLHIPVICLYQRPVWMSRFAIAQADFISMFAQGRRDEKVAKEMCDPAALPSGQKIGPLELRTLPDYYSLWHDVGKGKTELLRPAPSRRDILDHFRSRLTPQRQRNFV